MNRHSCEFCRYCQTGRSIETGSTNWCEKQRRGLPDYMNNRALRINNGCMYHDFVQTSALTGQRFKDDMPPEWKRL